MTPCGKFCDYSFNGLGFIVRTDRQTDRQKTDRITHADEHLTPATVVGVSNSGYLHTIRGEWPKPPSSEAAIWAQCA